MNGRICRSMFDVHSLPCLTNDACSRKSATQRVEHQLCGPPTARGVLLLALILALLILGSRGKSLSLALTSCHSVHSLNIIVPINCRGAHFVVCLSSVESVTTRNPVTK